MYVEGVVVSEDEVIVRCPFCDCEFEATPPDSWLSEYSLVEPSTDDAQSIMKKREVVCKNPECEKSFTVYWHAPKDYLNVI